MAEVLYELGGGVKVHHAAGNVLGQMRLSRKLEKESGTTENAGN
jgi:hypothetical protein